jgi:predicted RNA-binding Zn-ribbon protein involved in translation (DUF1610 family)
MLQQDKTCPKCGNEHIGRRRARTHALAASTVLRIRATVVFWGILAAGLLLTGLALGEEGGAFTSAGTVCVVPAALTWLYLVYRQRSGSSRAGRVHYKCTGCGYRWDATSKH